jgi:hypothetical protein
MTQFGSRALGFAALRNAGATAAHLRRVPVTIARPNQTGRKIARSCLVMIALILGADPAARSPTLLSTT